MADEKRDATIRNVRITFPYLSQPRRFDENSDPNYEVTFLIPKDDTKNMGLLQALLDDAIVFGKAKRWNGTVPRVLKLPWVDGDEPQDNGKDRGPECAGHWIMRAKCPVDRRATLIVQDENGNDLLPNETSGVFYAGCYVNAIVQLTPYGTGLKGVNAKIYGIRKVQDGERLGGYVANPDDLD